VASFTLVFLISNAYISSSFSSPKYASSGIIPPYRTGTGIAYTGYSFIPSIGDEDTFQFAG